MLAKRLEMALDSGSGAATSKESENIFEDDDNEDVVLVEPLQCFCTVGDITACCSRHDSDILLFTQTSWAQVGSHRQQFPSLCTAHFAPVLRRFPLLHGSGASIPGIGILIYSRCWDIEW